MKLETINNDSEYTYILNSFLNKCYENQIWFSLAGKTLLSAITNKNYYKSDHYLEVFMTFESFDQLKNKYNENIIDSTNTLDYFYLNPIYVEKDINKLIKINILIPASIKKTEKFYSLKNSKRQKIGYWKYRNYDRGFLKKFWYNKIMSKFLSPLLWEEIYANIYSDKFEGYFVVDEFQSNINNHWIPSITFKMQNVNFLSINCPILKESKLYLQKKFGLNWQNFAENKPNKFNFLVISNKLRLNL